MGGMEFNKVAAAILTAGIAYSGFGILSDNLVHATKLEHSALKIKGEDSAPAAAAGPAAKPIAPIGPLLASAKISDGEAFTKKVCIACHNFQQGQGNKVGPLLYGVVGRERASFPGYTYSAALSGKKGKWTYDDLNAWLEKPAAFAPGTKMAYAGIDDDQTRADVIDYLHTLSPNPEPLPSADAKTPPAKEPDAKAPTAGRPGLSPARQRLSRPIPVDPRFVAAAEEAADLAGIVIRPYFRAPIDADRKADESPVTIADRAAEQTMRSFLSRVFPEHGLLGEEYGLERENAAYRWVLDPIDGTRAFITGRPAFGTLLALLHEGRSGTRRDRPANHRRTLAWRCRRENTLFRAIRRPGGRTLLRNHPGG